MRMIHIVAGSVSLVAGALALYSAKGRGLHRMSGLIFAMAMIAMTVSAFVIAAFLRPDTVNAVAGALTFYLVVTGLTTVRVLPGARNLSVILLFAVLAITGFVFQLGMTALNNATGEVDGIPAPPLFMFAILGSLGALGDMRMLRAGELKGTSRLSRHLWRMCVAMLLATASLFLGQAQVFPEFLRSRLFVLAIPVFLVLFTTLFWLVRVRMHRRAA